MQYKVTLKTDTFSDDIIVDAEPTEKIGAIATQILANMSNFANDMQSIPSPTLGYCNFENGQYQKTIIESPSTSLRDSLVANGCVISLYNYAFSDAFTYTQTVFGTLFDHQSGQIYPLGKQTLIGRNADLDINVKDLEISHLQCQIAFENDNFNVQDLGSTNGTEYDTNAQKINVGKNEFTIKKFIQPIYSELQTINSNSNWYNRYMLIPKLPANNTLKRPQKPELKEAPKLPTIAVITPLLMGAMMYTMAPNPMTATFALLSPFMAIGNWISGKISARKSNKQIEKEWQNTEYNFSKDLDSLRKNERQILQLRYCEPQHIQLWNKHFEDEDFAEIRFGLGNRQSVITIDDDKLSNNTGEENGILELAPITVNLQSSIGIYGQNAMLVPVITGFLEYILRSFSPGTLRIGTILTDFCEFLDWLKWCPHLDSNLIATNGTNEENVLAKLNELLENSNKLPVIMIVNRVNPENWWLYEQIITKGKENGVYFIQIAAQKDELSWQLDTRVEIIDQHSARIIDKLTVQAKEIREIPNSTPENAQNFVKSITNLEDMSKVPTENDRIPKYIELSALMPFDPYVFADNFAYNWQSNANYLEAKIGVDCRSDFTIDLRKSGPHALVGGTTGAGKSEFLQTWITSLALNSSPERLNFLLIDYKGGAAFGDCSKFPHTIGLVTDLDAHLAKRVMASLAAELRRRERILAEFGAKDLATLERENLKAAPANLIIFVDEFAALATELPDFVDQIVDIGARGRSLGIHLVMATQRPNGIIKDSLKANTNLRIALRVADEMESKDIIGIASAAHIERTIPGRAFVKSDTNAPVEIQSAYIGHLAGARQSSVKISSFALGVTKKWASTNTDNEVNTNNRQATFLNAMVKQLQYAYLSGNYQTPHKVWLDPLPKRLTWEGISSGIALLDDPENQLQTAVLPSSENTLITGKAGSGKSTALMTYFYGIMCLDRYVNSYIINCTKAKYSLEISSHAQIIDISNIEQIWRLFSKVLQDQPTDQAKTLIIIDGIDILKDTFESDFYDLTTQFLRILSSTNALNVQILASQMRTNGIYSNWQSFFTERIYLPLANNSEYAYAGIDDELITSEKVPGRAICDGREMQIRIVENSSPTTSQVVRETDKIGNLLQNYSAKDCMNKNGIIGYNWHDLSPVSIEKSIGKFRDNCKIFIIGGASTGKTSVAHLIVDQVKKCNEASGSIKTFEITELTPQMDEAKIEEAIGNNNVITCTPQILSANWVISNALKRADIVVILGVDEVGASQILAADYPKPIIFEKIAGRGWLIEDGMATLLQFAK